MNSYVAQQNQSGGEERESQGARITALNRLEHRSPDSALCPLSWAMGSLLTAC